MDRQAALPPGILDQSDYVGGALALNPKATPDTVWDELDQDQAASAPGGGAGLLQDLSDFSAQIGTVSQQVLPYNRRRAYLFIQNNGAADVRIAFGHDADVNTSLKLSANGGFIEPILGTVQSVHAVAVAGDNQVTFIEGYRI